MLVAYGPNNQPVIANETPLEQLQHWSHDRVLRCPNCRGVVYVRGGTEKQVQVHFVHHQGECAWSTETESVRHMHGKLLLAQWLQAQFPQAQVRLEERLPEPNRIADIFIMHSNGRKWAIEFQCAPLDYAEWRHRHEAYRKARILDIWIVGDNRREKHESFTEAILAASREILFLDPLAAPPRIWLLWRISSNYTQYLQQPQHILLEQQAKHSECQATLIAMLDEVRLNEQGHITHDTRTLVEQQTQLLQTMQQETSVNETTLTAYLRYYFDNKALRVALIPLLRAYARDPDLLRRYNYGRGLPKQPVTDDDLARIRKAHEWLMRLHKHGYTKDWWQLVKEHIPAVGSYIAFTRYIDMLLTLS